MDKKRRIKGILKSTPGFQTPNVESSNEAPTSSVKNSGGGGQMRPTGAMAKKAAHYDEMNIISTLHPADKDYGKMKVTEPDTPFNYDYKPGEEEDAIDAAQVAEKLEALKKNEATVPPSKSESETEGRKKFEARRKSHYNEYLQLVAQKRQEKDE